MNSHRTLAALCLTALLVGCATVNEVAGERARLSGYTAYADGDVRRARVYFKQAVERNPTDWRSLYYFARIELDHGGSVSDARRHLQTAYAVRTRRPDSPMAASAPTSGRRVPAPTRSRIADALAEALHREGQSAQLAGFLREVVDEYGATADYVRMGDYLHKEGDHDAALAAYLKSTRIAADDDPSPYLALADFYENIGDRDNALVALRQAYGISPRSQGLAERIRAYGLVPGPTLALPAGDRAR